MASTPRFQSCAGIWAFDVDIHRLALTPRLFKCSIIESKQAGWIQSVVGTLESMAISIDMKNPNFCRRFQLIFPPRSHLALIGFEIRNLITLVSMCILPVLVASEAIAVSKWPQRPWRPPNSLRDHFGLRFKLSDLDNLCYHASIASKI